MKNEFIHTNEAPQAIGCYSQAVKVHNTVYLSGQIGLNPQTMELVEGFTNQANQAFTNLIAVLKSAGAGTEHVVKVNIYLTDMVNFKETSEVMTKYFTAPYPARAVVAVASLPKNGLIEVEATAVIR